MSLTEQDRVLLGAALLSRWKWIETLDREMGAFKALEDAAEVHVSTEEVAELLALPIEVVNAAMENHADDGLANWQ